MQKIPFNSLTLDERNNYYAKNFKVPGVFQELFGDSIEERALDVLDYGRIFRQHIELHLNKYGFFQKNSILENLHSIIDDEWKAYNFQDGINKISTLFYDMTKEFQNDYTDFMRKIAESLPGKFKKYAFQKTPTIRIHCPNGHNSNHYPRYHTDIGYGHPPEEINLWMPLTEQLYEHGFRLMNLCDSVNLLEEYKFNFSDFIYDAIHSPNFSEKCHEKSKEVDVPFGKALLFDARRIHTGMPLKNHTRVSIDVRLIPIDALEKSKFLFQGTGRRQIKFVLGEAYTC